MDIKVLDKEYVLKNGVHYEQLDYDPITSRELDPREDDLGFTGLSYEMYPNNSIRWYGYFEDGFDHGDSIEFHLNGKIKSDNPMERGVVNGIFKEWDEHGNLILIGEARLGMKLKYKKMDNNGSILEEKKEPTQNDIQMVRKIEDAKKRESEKGKFR